MLGPYDTDSYWLDELTPEQARALRAKAWRHIRRLNRILARVIWRRAKDRRMLSATDIRFCALCVEETIHRHSHCTVCGTPQPYLRPRLGDLDEKRSMQKHRENGAKATNWGGLRPLVSTANNR